MTSLTTIKVPTELRDRLAKIARQQNTTLAGAISLSLETIEEMAFWETLDRALTAESVVGLPLVPPVRDLLEPEPEWDL